MQRERGRKRKETSSITVHFFAPDRKSLLKGQNTNIIEDRTSFKLEFDLNILLIQDLLYIFCIQPFSIVNEDETNPVRLSLTPTLLEADNIPGAHKAQEPYASLPNTSHLKGKKEKVQQNSYEKKKGEKKQKQKRRDREKIINMRIAEIDWLHLRDVKPQHMM
ncbi:uncharacterized protein LOC144682022 isoform X2 [Cetorhinus maximus]